MPAFEKNNTVGKRFDKTHQPRNNGRKPSTLKKLIKDNGISIQDVKLVMKNIVMTKTESELKDLCSDPGQPMLVRTITNAFLTDFKKGNMNNLDSILDRIYGKAEETVNTKNPLDTLTHEEKFEALKSMYSELNIQNDEA
jgi:hypothetical protein